MPGGMAEPPSGRKFYSNLRNSSRFQCKIDWKQRYSNCAKEIGECLRCGLPDQDPIHRLVESPKHADSCFAVQFAINFKHPGESEL
jgi:hypothetical protein